MSVHDITDNIFEEVGDFGSYQSFIFAFVGFASTIPAIVGFSFSFYAATPSFRCKIPNNTDDTFEIKSEYHKNLIDKFIPFLSNSSFMGIYEKCTVRSYLDNKSLDNFTINQCNEWVFSKEYYENTLITEVVLFSI